MNREVCIESASSVDGQGGRKEEKEDVSTSGCSTFVHVVPCSSFVINVNNYFYSWLPWLHKHSEGGTQQLYTETMHGARV